MRRLALSTLATLLIAAPAVPLAAQQAPAGTSLSLEQRMQLRCSAAFAIVASEQQRGAPGAAAWPPLGERGREYFVRASARLMDELGLGREEVAGLLSDEVAGLQLAAAEAADPATHVDGVMRPCLTALEASGL